MPGKILTLGFGMWLTAVAGGSAWFALYSVQGDVVPVSDHWPVESRLPRRDDDNLLAFIHPKCECSQATLTNLAEVCQRSGQRATIVFPTYGLDWHREENVRFARKFECFDIHLDEDGAECRRFEAKVSGICRLYASDGRLLFDGGITLARGHVGENDAARSLANAIYQPPTSVVQFPAFGCGL